MPKNYQLWREEFKALAGNLYRGPVLTAPLILTVTFVTPKGTLRGDIDNTVGAVFDSLQPWLIANDRQVAELHAYVVKGEQEIQIEISERP